MKTHGKRLLSCLLALLLLATSVPLGGLSNLAIQANAANLDGYNAIAAAEWAKEQVGSYSSILFGTRYWYVGGDCANFVSEAIYMGGLDPTAAWNHSGYNAHYSPLTAPGSVRSSCMIMWSASVERAFAILPPPTLKWAT